jgi:cysteinylglycine-S-conjugate dipeptidase
VKVEVNTAKIPVHSGMGGGGLPDAAIALCAILGRLYWDNGALPIPGFYEQVRTLTDKEKAAFNKLPFDGEQFRQSIGMVPNSRFAIEKGFSEYAQTWRRPAVTVIAQEASSIKGASNQVLPKATAIVSCRIVPDQKTDHVLEKLTAFFTTNPPWGSEVVVTPIGPPVDWWMTDPNGPAFEAALAAMRAGYDHDPVAIGCGGSIGFVGPLSDLFGGAPALLLGIEDPASNAHAPNESLHEGDFKKLMSSLVRLFDNLGKLTPAKVK